MAADCKKEVVIRNKENSCFNNCGLREIIVIQAILQVYIDLEFWTPFPSVGEGYNKAQPIRFDCRTTEESLFVYRCLHTLPLSLSFEIGSP
jgi:hypothetical protein